MKGWFRERYRHSLAARGIITSRYRYDFLSKKLPSTLGAARQLNGVTVARTHGIPITIREPASPGTAWPVTPSEVKQVIDKLPEPVIMGVKEINFRNPGPEVTKQPLAYAQYVRSKPRPRINIFTQKFDGQEFIDVDPELRTPAALNKYTKNYVLVHEPVHHYFQHNLGMDKDPVLTEESRVDLFLKGGNPFNKVELDAEKKLRVKNFGPTGSV
jgi:hypothetical protein